ncbi:carbohydrate ABC transporter membrane protein 2 (CUT1 family) [Streptomyces sp. 1114.5]|uniref:carbohydrate ABC transporter permease n=1 Tax=Streptomyces sp. 1114.5 TaxID=1938830 RepID=UPI000EB2CBF2|nr:carbohydrate ABC transporter permease [Streptomyces sp. 1114.5]RKT19144.1 carbohydrate ABC transporter membrane protein 2 (CUT1 family) [Streptomyces sp. 1114.5]
MNLKKLRGWPLTFLLAAITGLSVGPFYWLVTATTRKDTEIFDWPPSLLPGGHLGDNLDRLDRRIGLLRVVGNSLLVAGIQTLGALVVALLAGYAFAKFRFRGRTLLFALLLSTLVVPEQVMLVPLFKMMMSFGLLDTYQALILPGLCVPFAIFLMRQSLAGLPDELLDAARVDGAGEFRVLWSVVVPVMRPVLAALSIFLFLGSWNQFVWPLIALRSPGMHTLPVALATLHGNQSTTDYGAILSGTALSTLPMMVLFLVLQRQFISGLLAGATKG